MKYVLATMTLVMVVLAGIPARAQFQQQKEKTPLDLLYEREEAERKDNERQYNEQMKRLKGQGPTATSSDPWKGVRSTNDEPAKR
jgi:hypothetical protein